MFKIPKVINVSPKPFYSLPLLPLRDIVLFPFMMAPIFVGRAKSINALENAIEDDKEIFFSAQKNAHTDDPGEDDLYKIKDVDWIIEVVIERLDIKQQVFENIEKYRNKGTLITSNTSGIPIQFMNKGRSEDFQKHFAVQGYV